MATSLADFWGRRWNITTSHLLRALVYDPIMEGLPPERSLPSEPVVDGPLLPSLTGCLIKPGPDDHHQPKGPHRPSLKPGTRVLRMCLGVTATFFVSGAVHEIIFWALSVDGQWRWKWLLYFTIQVSSVLHHTGEQCTSPYR